MDNGVAIDPQVISDAFVQWVQEEMRFPAAVKKLGAVKIAGDVVSMFVYFENGEKQPIIADYSYVVSPVSGNPVFDFCLQYLDKEEAIVDENDPMEQLLSSTDAMQWAREFERCKRENNWSLDDIDVNLMVGWFANAMAAQESEDNRERSEALKKIQELEKEIKRIVREHNGEGGFF